MELVEAKREFTTRIVLAFSPYIYQGIRSIWDSSTLGQPDHLKYRLFQGSLSLVKRWNSLIIDKEYARILSHFDNNKEYLDKIIEIVFVAHLKILKSVCSSASKTVLDIPNVKTFIHMCYIQAAREFYEDPTAMDPMQGQRGYKQAMKLIQSAIEQTIRQMTPLETLLLSQQSDDLTAPEPERELKREPEPEPEPEPAYESEPTTAVASPAFGEQKTDAPVMQAFLSPPPVSQSPDLNVMPGDDVDDVKPEDIKHIVMNKPTTVRFSTPSPAAPAPSPSPEPFFFDD